MVDRNNLLEELFRRTDDKLDELAKEVKANHKELSQDIQDLKLKFSEQQAKVGVMKWLVNGSGPVGFILAIIAVCKEFWHYPSK